MNKAAILDVDGVLADFEDAFCEKFGYNGRHLVNLEERYPEYKDEIEMFVMSSLTYESLDIIPLGVKIARWCEDNGFDIYIVSSRPAYTVKVTGLWLKQNKIPFHFLEVGVQPKINTIIRADPMFVVDDMLKVCEDCYRFNVYSVLFDQPWNQGEIPDVLVERIKDFRSFEQFIENINEIYRIF